MVRHVCVPKECSVVLTTARAHTHARRRFSRVQPCSSLVVVTRLGRAWRSSTINKVSCLGKLRFTVRMTIDKDRWIGRKLCQHCSTTIGYTAGRTSNLFTHLRWHHPNVNITGPRKKQSGVQTRLDIVSASRSVLSANNVNFSLLFFSEKNSHETTINLSTSTQVQ